MEQTQDLKVDLTQIIVDRLMSHDDHLSFSSLSQFWESPKDFIKYKCRQKEQTDAMILGSVFHCLVLEPQEFDKRYFILNDEAICLEIGGAKPRATSVYKQWKANETQKAAGMDIIDLDTYRQGQQLARNVLFNRASSKILDLCWLREKPIEWEFKNFKFKGFIDGRGKKIMCDLKLMQSAEKRKAQRTIIEMGYFLQAAMYLHAEGEKLDYYVIAADRNDGVSVHHLEPRLLTYGMEQYNMIVDKFNECIIREAFDQSYDFWAERWDGIYVHERPGYFY